MAKTKAPINATDNLPQTRSALRGLASLREIDCTDQADVLLSRQRSNKKPMNTAILTRINHSAIISIMLNFRRIMMGINFGGLLKSMINPANLAMLAMGPGGWAQIAVKTLVSAVAQQALQQIGQELGLPQSIIDLGKQFVGNGAGTNTLGGLGSNAISEAMSGISESGNLSPMESGNLDRLVQDSFRKLVSSMMESDEFKAAKAGGKGESVFMKIARILGEQADKKLEKMSGIADQIGSTKDGTKQNEIASLTGKMQGYGQEFGLISNAMSNVIKSIGDGVSTIARKG
jgi:hypothetical protein